MPWNGPASSLRVTRGADEHLDNTQTPSRQPHETQAWRRSIVDVDSTPEEKILKILHSFCNATIFGPGNSGHKLG